MKKILNFCGAFILLGGGSLWGFVGIGDAGERSLSFTKATAAFMGSQSTSLEAPADRLREEIINECATSGTYVLRKAAADAAIGQVLDLVKLKPVLTLGDVNTLLQSPLSVPLPSSVSRCLRSLAAFYFVYPDEWVFIERASPVKNSLSGIEELIKDYTPVSR